MDFTDDAIVLSARRHGEANAVLSVLTREHGRHMGLVKGGASRLAVAASALGRPWALRISVASSDSSRERLPTSSTAGSQHSIFRVLRRLPRARPFSSSR